MHIKETTLSGALGQLLSIGILLCVATTASTALAEQETFVLKASASGFRDDNLYRLPENISFPSLGARSDLIRSLSLAANIARDISRQHLSLDASISSLRYRDHANLDNTGNTVVAAWQGEFGSRWKNALHFDNSRRLSNFADVRTTQKNIATVRSMTDKLSYRLTPAFFATIDVGTSRISNSSVSAATSDYSTSFREVGLQFVSPSSNQIKIGYRQTSGHYPNPQLVVLGRASADILIDNSYAQQDLDLSGSWAATGASQISGRIGMTRRHYGDFSARDYNGSTGTLNYSWNQGGPFAFTVDARRAIDTTTDVTSSYVVTNGISIRPTWTPTAKIAVNGALDWTRRNPLGDPARLLTGFGSQADQTRTIDLALTYAPTRRIALVLYAKNERRFSNVPLFAYQDNVLGLTSSFTY